MRFAIRPPVGRPAVSFRVRAGAAQTPAPAGPGRRVFDTAGPHEFEIPYGVNRLMIEGWSGGGGGGGGTTSADTGALAGGGGGGGAYGACVLGEGAMVPGSALQIELSLSGGNDGAGVLNDTGHAGWSGYVALYDSDPLLYYFDMSGGQGGAVFEGTGGAGGTCTFTGGVEVVAYVPGHDGNAATNAVTGGGGGDGPANGGGTGGAGTATANGGNAVGMGAGGGGSRRAAPGTGGNGGPGRIVISWPPSDT